MPRLNDALVDSTGRVRQVSEHMIRLFAITMPYTAAVGKTTEAFNSTPEWPVESPATANTTPIPDGKDVEEADLNNYESLFGMLQGRVCETREPYGVGNRAGKLARNYGRDRNRFKEYGRKAMEAITRGMEKINIGFQDSYRETQSSKPVDMTRGFLRWIQNGSYDPIELTIPTAAKAPTTNVVTSRTNASDVLESDFNGVLQSISTAMRTLNGDFLCLVSPDMQTAINNWAYSQTQSSTVLPLRRFTQDASKEKLTLAVTQYQTTWGRAKFHPHFEMLSGTSSYATVYAATADNGYGRTAAAQKMDAALAAATKVHMLIVNLGYAKIYDVESPVAEVLPNGGGGPKGAVRASWINAVTNPQAHGAIYKITA